MMNFSLAIISSNENATLFWEKRARLGNDASGLSLHVLNMWLIWRDRWTNRQMKQQSNEGGYQNIFVDHLIQCRISLWPKTAEKRGFCTGVMDGWTDRWMDGQMDGWMDRRTDGWTEKEEEKLPHMCESIDHRPLRSRCPKGEIVRMLETIGHWPKNHTCNFWRQVSSLVLKRRNGPTHKWMDSLKARPF